MKKQEHLQLQHHVRLRGREVPALPRDGSGRQNPQGNRKAGMGGTNTHPGESGAAGLRRQGRLGKVQKGILLLLKHFV